MSLVALAPKPVDPAVTKVQLSSPTQSSRLLAMTLALTAAIIVFVPVDFVAVSEPWRVLGLVSLLIGGLLGLVVLTNVRSRIVWPSLAFIVLLIFFNQFVNYNPIAFITLLLPIVAGVGFVASGRWLLGALVTLSMVVSVSLGIELVMQQHVFGTIFGVENYVSSSGSKFRARGIIGQAVPAAMMSIGICAAVLILSEDAGRYRTAIRLSVVLATAVSVLASGTRSSIICAGILLFIYFVTRLRRGAFTNMPGRRNAAWIAPFAASVSLIAVIAYWNTLAKQRIFSFSELAGSESFENRSYASLIFSEWSDSCKGLCLAVGSGARDLLATLSTGLGFRGFTTIDNMYLSLVWDFGLPVLLGLAAIVTFALMALFAGGSPESRAGALLILSVIVSGFFYDALYIRPVLFIFGVGIALLGIKFREARQNE